MTSKIVKLNEGALLAAGLPRDFVETMRHLVRQAGAITFDTTLPELASQTDALTPVVNGLTITVTATNQVVDRLETEATEHTFVDGSIVRRLNEIQAELEQANSERVALSREISRLRDDLGMYESEQLETGSSIRRKLGVSTLTGSNTGDQTITLTGDVTGSGGGSFATTVANNAITLAKMATMATASILGRNTAGTGNVEVLSASTVKTILALDLASNTLTTSGSTTVAFSASEEKDVSITLSGFASTANFVGSAIPASSWAGFQVVGSGATSLTNGVVRVRNGASAQNVICNWICNGT